LFKGPETVRTFAAATWRGRFQIIIGPLRYSVRDLSNRGPADRKAVGPVAPGNQFDTTTVAGEVEAPAPSPSSGN